MSTTKIYLDIPDDIQILLEQNHVSLANVLSDAGIEQTVTYATLPYQTSEGARSKDLVLVIIAASAAILAVGHAVSQVISTLQDKPHVVEIHELEVIRDADGRVLTDVSGRPILKPVMRYELLEPANQDSKQELEFRAGLTEGVVVKVRTAETQPGQPARR